MNMPVRIDVRRSYSFPAYVLNLRTHFSPEFVESQAACDVSAEQLEW